ncbi:uncharacterized protein LOC120067502 [Benincasa hispida]|uniref:uncharacterized protein LOC120067502 n=1 Tax=Benincasa hispida TaxID=102211 RepID=UPI001901A662|nr:uncharacterized protein LOC120067502 [Benincasa hispida]
MEVVSGALDGTYIKVNVSVVDQPRYRTRNGEIATNILVVCDQNGEFVFVLPGWEGSAADSRVLRDAISQPYGLRVPKGYYYLCDDRYPNTEGILVPYRGERYHLSDWHGAGNASTTAREFFNMKHSSARNVIERTEMGIGAMLDVPDEKNSASVGLDGDHIEFVESSEE